MKGKITLLVCVAVLAFGIALFAGPHSINPFRMDGTEEEILLHVRLPRVFAAALIGIALGSSGAVLQGILRNPLADPYILGLSSGASLAASAGLILGIASFAVPLLAFFGAVVTGGIVGIMSMRRGGIWPERLLLAGIGLGFLFSALLMLLMSLSTDEGLRRAILWMFGDLSTAEWSTIPYGLFFITTGIVIALLRSRALNSLILGDDLAHSLGFSPQRERLILFVSVCLMTSSSVSMGGMIGFIGLLMPHIMRFLVGSNNALLIPCSALAGGSILMISDLLGRTVIAPTEIPSGIITTLIGAPYFLYLLKKRDILNE
ncbi:MAG: iron ABC transporter permease [Alphaproteobacteria bacterium]|uniref:Iron ABC transporter permease n=1 Tax=Candidatus Nitrobium versatile TaxID=2884831 RepID=A0A953J7Y7_9BACT|nr:iron ABC transporter permease [Candidatus Nitrobium versatile]